MRNTEGNSELLARIDERTQSIQDTLVNHLLKYEKRNLFINKAFLFLLFLILVMNVERASTFFSIISKAFAGQ